MRRNVARLLSGIIFAGMPVFGALPAGAGANIPEQAPAQASTRADAGSAAKLAVARISVIEGGALVVQRGDTQKQVAGAINAPLFPGDFVTTGEGARAEVQFDGFSVLRLSQNAQVRIVKDNARMHLIQIATGTAAVAVLREEGAVTAIDTPSVTVRVRKPADVRVSVDAAGTTSVTARSGTATLETPQQNYALESGTTYVASGSAAKPSVAKDSGIGYDAFDDFNAARDKALYAAIDTDTNVPARIAGYDNLNSYGRWVSVEPYGEVWTPNGVSSDWVPYRDGQWSWNEQYGWTWVSSEAWGWVPYHYGRWFYQAGDGWCWVPPVLASAQDWQPALVGFFSFGSDGSAFSSGYGAFGWVPLAPSENFYPWYGYNPGYSPPPVVYIPPPTSSPNPRPSHFPNPVHRTPPVRKVPVKPPFRNAAFGAATAVDAGSFRSGDFSHMRGVDITRLGNVSLVRGPVPLVPSSQNQAFTRAPVRAPVTISHTFSQSRFWVPASRIASPSAWNHLEPTHGAGATSHSGSSTPVQFAPIRQAPVRGAPVSQPVRAPVSKPVRAPVSPPVRAPSAPSAPARQDSGSHGSSSHPPHR
jgi:hypothetical protein